MQVGQTLTAEIGTIADADGVPAESEFSYIWFLVDAGVETEITGATDKTYLVPSVQEGKKLKVRVSFHPTTSDTKNLSPAQKRRRFCQLCPARHKTLRSYEPATPRSCALLGFAPTSGGTPTSYQYRQSDDDGTSWSDWTDIPGSDGDTVGYTAQSISANDTRVPRSKSAETTVRWLWSRICQRDRNASRA